MTTERTDSIRTTDASARDDQPKRSGSGLSGNGRRQFLRAAGGVAVAGLLAGCASDGSNGNGGGDGGGGATSVDDWLAETDNYDSVADRTDEDAVTVEVGPEANEYVFAPPAIRVRPGTTVTWQWVGSGHHNVVAKDGAFDSGQPEKKATFEHTFETPGTALYYCEPHEGMGMNGAIVVESEEGESSGTTTTQTEPAANRTEPA